MDLDPAAIAWKTWMCSAHATKVQAAVRRKLTQQRFVELIKSRPHSWYLAKRSEEETLEGQQLSLSGAVTSLPADNLHLLEELERVKAEKEEKEVELNNMKKQYYEAQKQFEIQIQELRLQIPTQLPDSPSKSSSNTAVDFPPKSLEGAQNGAVTSVHVVLSGERRTAESPSWRQGHRRWGSDSTVVDSPVQIFPPKSCFTGRSESDSPSPKSSRSVHFPDPPFATIREIEDADKSLEAVPSPGLHDEVAPVENNEVALVENSEAGGEGPALDMLRRLRIGRLGPFSVLKVAISQRPQVQGPRRQNSLDASHWIANLAQNVERSRGSWFPSFHVPHVFSGLLPEATLELDLPAMGRRKKGQRGASEDFDAPSPTTGQSNMHTLGDPLRVVKMKNERRDPKSRIQDLFKSNTDVESQADDGDEEGKSTSPAKNGGEENTANSVAPPTTQTNGDSSEPPAAINGHSQPDANANADGVEGSGDPDRNESSHDAAGEDLLGATNSSNDAAQNGVPGTLPDLVLQSEFAINFTLDEPEPPSPSAINAELDRVAATKAIDESGSNLEDKTKESTGVDETPLVPPPKSPVTTSQPDHQTTEQPPPPPEQSSQTTPPPDSSLEPPPITSTENKESSAAAVETSHDAEGSVNNVAVPIHEASGEGAGNVESAAVQHSGAPLVSSTDQAPPPATSDENKSNNPFLNLDQGEMKEPTRPSAYKILSPANVQPPPPQTQAPDFPDPFRTPNAPVQPPIVPSKTEKGDSPLSGSPTPTPTNLDQHSRQTSAINSRQGSDGDHVAAMAGDVSTLIQNSNTTSQTQQTNELVEVWSPRRGSKALSPDGNVMDIIKKFPPTPTSNSFADEFKPPVERTATSSGVEELATPNGDGRTTPSPADPAPPIATIAQHVETVPTSSTPGANDNSTPEVLNSNQRKKNKGGGQKDEATEAEKAKAAEKAKEEKEAKEAAKKAKEAERQKAQEEKEKEAAKAKEEEAEKKRVKEAEKAEKAEKRRRKEEKEAREAAEARIKAEVEAEEAEAAREAKKARDAEKKKEKAEKKAKEAELAREAEKAKEAELAREAEKAKESNATPITQTPTPRTTISPAWNNAFISNANEMKGAEENGISKPHAPRPSTPPPKLAWGVQRPPAINPTTPTKSYPPTAGTPSGSSRTKLFPETAPWATTPASPVRPGTPIAGTSSATPVFSPPPTPISGKSSPRKSRHQSELAPRSSEDERVHRSSKSRSQRTRSPTPTPKHGLTIDTSSVIGKGKGKRVSRVDQPPTASDKGSSIDSLATSLASGGLASSSTTGDETEHDVDKPTWGYIPSPSTYMPAPSAIRSFFNGFMSTVKSKTLPGGFPESPPRDEVVRPPDRPPAPAAHPPSIPQTPSRDLSVHGRDDVVQSPEVEEPQFTLFTSPITPIPEPHHSTTLDKRQLLEEGSGLDEEILKEFVAGLKIPSSHSIPTLSERDTFYVANVVAGVVKEMWRQRMFTRSEEFVQKVCSRVESRVKDLSGATQLVAIDFWLSNTIQLSSVLESTHADLQSSFTSDQTLRTTSDRIEATLYNLIQTLYRLWIQSADTSIIYNLLEPHAENERRIDIIVHVDELWNDLEYFHVDDGVIKQLFESLSSYFEVGLFNGLMTKPESRAWKIVSNVPRDLGRIERWYDRRRIRLLGKREELRQALEVLKLKQIKTSTLDDISAPSHLLNNTQLKRLLSSKYHRENPKEIVLAKALITLHPRSKFDDPIELERPDVEAELLHFNRFAKDAEVSIPDGMEMPYVRRFLEIL